MCSELSLPCVKGGGTASAVTEGLSYHRVDIFAHTTKIIIYFTVRDSQNGNAICTQIRCSFLVGYYLLCTIMLRAIQFYCKLRLRTIKIHNVFAKRFLPEKFYRICAQKIIPQMSLFLGHFFAQFSGKRNNSFVILAVHNNPPVRSADSPLYTRGPFSQFRLFFYLILLKPAPFVNPAGWPRYGPVSGRSTPPPPPCCPRCPPPPAPTRGKGAGCTGWPPY